MEAVNFPTTAVRKPRHDWAVRADAETRKNVITSIYLKHEILEAHNQHLMKKYARAERELPEFAAYRMEDAEIALVGYGISGRVLRSTVDIARKNGIRAGLIRPITVWPFPRRAIAEATEQVQRFLVVELSNGQMVQDVRDVVNGRRPVSFYGRQGGMVPTPSEVYEVLVGTKEEDHAGHCIA